MTKINCEIKRLEDQLENMFSKYNKIYNGINLSTKNAFEVEMLRAEVHSVVERNKINSYKLAIIGVIATLTIQLMIISMSMENLAPKIIVAIVYLIVFSGWMYAIKLYGITRRLDSKGLNLIDMLIERKKKLESTE